MRKPWFRLYLSAARRKNGRTMRVSLPFRSLAACLCAVHALGQPTETSLGPESLFGLGRVVDVHIRMTPEEWAKMRPPKDVKLDVLSVMLAFEDLVKDAAKGGHFRKDESFRPGLAGYMGLNHQYGRADVTIDGETVSGVGVRYKGNGTFLEGHPRGKTSFKIDFNEYDDALAFRGLTKINLNNNVTDPSLLREALSYALFREAGVPCSRVGFAKVSVSVPGMFDDEPQGLYTVVEQVDKRFLKDRHGSAKGLLLKPSTFGVFRYFGETWDEYEIAYVPKTDPTPEQKRRVIDFAKLLHQADDAAFEHQVEDYLDVDHFLRFVALNALLSNLDSFLGGAQNHYIYLEPDSNKFQFLPWDMDHSFGAFPLEGTPESRRDLSVDHPGGPRHTLIERVLAIPRHKQSYHAHLARYLEGLFAEDKMRRQIAEAANFLRPLIPANGEDARRRFENIVADGPREDEPHVMSVFVAKRRDSVKRQLEGRSPGALLFNQEPKTFPVRAILGFAVALAVLILFHAAVWLWGLVAGFRGGARWGVLNMCFYPLTPVIYGFRVRKDLGRRAAQCALFGCALVVAWIVAALVVFLE